MEAQKGISSWASIGVIRMVKAYVNIGVPKALAAAVDILMENTALGFVSRGEVLKHVLREYLLELVKAKVLPPEVLRRIE